MRIGFVAQFLREPSSLPAEREPLHTALTTVTGSRMLTVGCSGDSDIRVRLAPWVTEDDAVARDESSILCVVGEPRLQGKSLTARQMLSLWNDAGAEYLARVGGHFVLIILARESRQVVLIADRFGMEKVYFHASGGRLLVASELAAIRASRFCTQHLDEVAVGEFLTASHIISSRSFVRDVGIVPPATLIKWDGLRVTSTRYWQPEVGTGAQLSVDTWAERLGGAMQAAVSGMTSQQKIELPISGGLDSRCVAAFLRPGEYEAAHAISFGPNHCYDVRFGRQIARTLGIKHQALELDQEFFSTGFPASLSLCDGEISIEAFPALCLRQFAKPDRILLHGFLGDVLSGGHLLPTESFDDSPTPAEYLWKCKYVKNGFEDSLLGQILVPERAKSMVGAARQHFVDEFRRVEASTNQERGMLLEIEHRQARYVSYLQRSLSATGPSWTPFLEPEVINEFLALPLVHRRRQHAYRRMIRHFAPRLAEIGETSTGLKMSDLRVQHAPSGTAAKPCLPGIWRLLGLQRKTSQLFERYTGGRFSHRRMQHYIHLDVISRLVAASWFREHLFDPQLIDGWFQPEALARLWDDHVNRRADHSTRISNVIAFLEFRRFSGM